MKKLLIVGSEWPRLKHVDWSAWESVNILDYQGLILDLSAGPNVPSEANLRGKLNEFISSGHPVFLLLPHGDRIPNGSSSVTFLPNLSLSLTQESGKTLRQNGQDPLIRAYDQALDGHEFVMGLQHLAGTRLTAETVNNVNKTICAKYQTVYLLHPPARGKEKKAFEIILQYFGPDFEAPEPDPVPSWGHAIIQTLPGSQDCKIRIEKIDAQFKLLLEQKEEQVKRAGEIAKWAGLLWQGGTPLQDLVGQSLSLLGIPCSSLDPTAHTEDLNASIHGYDFIIEVTGSKGSIGIEKGRQLAQWVASASSPLTAKGLLIANANKEEPLDKRLPAVDYGTFVKELQDYAKKFHLALVDVRELFALVSAKLGGKNIDAERLCKELAGDGVVQLSCP